MARDQVLFIVAESGLESNNGWVVGGLFMLCVIVASLSVISMVIFVCGDSKYDHDSSKKRPKPPRSDYYYGGYQGGQDGGDGGGGGHGGCGGGHGGGCGGNN
ncbi:hypothetical protein ACOSP7_002196 [Xanthoceras sorbifolium]